MKKYFILRSVLFIFLVLFSSAKADDYIKIYNYSDKTASVKISGKCAINSDYSGLIHYSDDTKYLSIRPVSSKHTSLYEINGVTIELDGQTIYSTSGDIPSYLTIDENGTIELPSNSQACKLHILNLDTNPVTVTVTKSNSIEESIMIFCEQSLSYYENFTRVSISYSDSTNYSIFFRKEEINYALCIVKNDRIDIYPNKASRLIDKSRLPEIKLLPNKASQLID